MWMQHWVIRQVPYISIISADINNFVIIMLLQGVTDIVPTFLISVATDTC